jgi:elongation factor Ts
MKLIGKNWKKNFQKKMRINLINMSDIEKVKKLREATGAGFKDCNMAIKESNGDLDKAVEILRVKGISKASKKMSRDAKEGVVAVSGDEKKTSIIEVNCETDFVAKNDDFINFVKELSELNNEKNSNIDELNKSKMKNGSTVDENLVALIAKIGEKITIGKTKTITNSSTTNYQYLHTVVKDNLAKLAVVVSLETKNNSEIIKNFGKQLSMHIAASNPLALDSSLIDQKIIDKEQELVTEELKNSGKPEEIAKKISLGKMNKFKEENALLTQAWVMEPKKKVQDVLKELAINDLKIKEFSRIKIGE